MNFNMLDPITDKLFFTKVSYYSRFDLSILIGDIDHLVYLVVFKVKANIIHD